MKRAVLFPGRAFASEGIDTLTGAGATVLDPMCGSGTVVRLAAEHGRIGWYMVKANASERDSTVTRSCA